MLGHAVSIIEKCSSLGYGSFGGLDGMDSILTSLKSFLLHRSLAIRRMMLHFIVILSNHSKTFEGLTKLYQNPSSMIYIVCMLISMIIIVVGYGMISEKLLLEMFQITFAITLLGISSMAPSLNSDEDRGRMYKLISKARHYLETISTGLVLLDIFTDLINLRMRTPTINLDIIYRVGL